MAIAIFSFSAADAQISKKKIKTKTEKTEKHYQCPMKCEGEKTHHKNGKCPVCNMQMKAVKASNANAAVYQCPMKCEGDKTYAKAGKCPKCEMDLKKVTAKKATDGHDGHNHK